MALKRTALDGLMTELMRLVYDDTCCRCGLVVTGPNSHCAHFFSRRYNSTRWHPDNCLLLCAHCHDLVDREDAQEKASTWATNLGPVRYQALRDRHYQQVITYRKADKKEMSQHYKAEIVRLQKLRRDGARGVLQAASFD